jgi:Skp family chaperone for outer membrane proteins
MKQGLLAVCTAVCLTAGLSACQSAYYAAAEQVGYHKREILVDRVEDARDAQSDAEEQFQSAQEHLISLIEFDGGELQRVYDELADEYEDAVDAAERVTDRIDAIEDVADALFDEWEAELEEYSNQRLRRDSERKLKETQRRYDQLIVVMRRSEERMDPVLSALKDNVLYLKHNLNAQAVAALKTEFGQIERDIDVLIAEMRKAIASSNEFIESLQATDS